MAKHVSWRKSEGILECSGENWRNPTKQKLIELGALCLFLATSWISPHITSLLLMEKKKRATFFCSWNPSLFQKPVEELALSPGATACHSIWLPWWAQMHCYCWDWSWGVQVFRGGCHSDFSVISFFLKAVFHRQLSTFIWEKKWKSTFLWAIFIS